MANMDLSLPELLEKNGVKLSWDSDAPKQENATVDYEKNADEVVHTTQTGFGKELVPLNVLMQQVLDMVPQYSQLLPLLPGDHGRDMPISAKVPVVGETGFFKGNTEWTTGAGTIAQGNSKLATAEVAITQGQFIQSVDVSKRQLNYSVADVEQWLRVRIAQSIARTIDGVIINGDTTAGATGNVNLDDSTPPTGSYYLQQANGIRRTAIAGTGTTVDVGTFDFADLLSLLNVVGDFASTPSDLLWFFNRSTYNKALGISEFLDASKNGERSTVFTGSLTNILGADLITCRDVPKTEADGKVSVTGTNNTKGQLGLLYRPSVQYGYGQAPEIDVVKVPGKGISVIATFEFGFGIAQKLAGQTDSSVALGINVTL